MGQDLFKAFCNEYTKERNRLNAAAEQEPDALMKKLITANHGHSKLVDIIIAGIPADQVKDKMQSLTKRRESGVDSPVFTSTVLKQFRSSPLKPKFLR